MKLKYLILGREKVNYSICIMNYKFSRGKLARDGLKTHIWGDSVSLSNFLLSTNIRSALVFGKGELKEPREGRRDS